MDQVQIPCLDPVRIQVFLKQSGTWSTWHVTIRQHQTLGLFFFPLAFMMLRNWTHGFVCCRQVLYCRTIPPDPIIPDCPNSKAQKNWSLPQCRLQVELLDQNNTSMPQRLETTQPIVLNPDWAGRSLHQQPLEAPNFWPPIQQLAKKSLQLSCVTRKSHPIDLLWLPCGIDGSVPLWRKCAKGWGWGALRLVQVDSILYLIRSDKAKVKKSLMTNDSFPWDWINELWSPGRCWCIWRKGNYRDQLTLFFSLIFIQRALWVKNRMQKKESHL